MGEVYLNGEKMKLTIKIIILCFIYFTQVYSLSFSQENHWSTNGPHNARVMEIAIDPLNNEHLYIGTIEAGIYESSNSGQLWTHIDNDTLETVSRKIRIHPFAPDTMYASTARGVFRSNDAGQSWFRLNIPGGNTSEHRALDIHPKNPSIILTASGSPVWKSEDGGLTWTSHSVGFVFIQDIEFHPVDSNKVYLVTPSAESGNSIFISEDVGETWINIHNDMDSVGWAKDLAIDPADPNIMYIAKHVPNNTRNFTLSKTVDGGSHWINISPLNLSDFTLYHVTVSPIDHNVIFACHWSDGVFMSIDGGMTWEIKNNGINLTIANTIVVDSVTGIIYLGTFFDGIYRSLDNAETWEKISFNINNTNCRGIDINVRDPDSVYIAAFNGLYFSDNGAANWTQIQLPINSQQEGVNCVTVDNNNPNLIFAGYCFLNNIEPGGIARSIDGGHNWTLSESGLPEDFCVYHLKISYLSDTDRRIFAGSNVGLFYSDDLGVDWIRIDSDIPHNLDCDNLEICPSDQNVIFVADYNNIIYKSTDRGNSWIQLVEQPQFNTSQIVCDPIDENIIYADFGRDDALHKSIDGGDTWVDINNNIPRDDLYLISGISINPHNHDNIFVYSFHKGVYQSQDAGQNWESLNNGLNLGISGGSIIIDPVDTSRIYMSTWNYSVWSINRTTVSVEEDEPLPTEITLSQNYPNPFNAQTQIEFALPSSGHVEISVFDILGRQISTPLSKFMTAGYHSLNLNLNDHSSGLYFYALKTTDTEIKRKMVLLK